MNTILICLIICSIYSFVIYKILSYRLNKKIDNKTFLKEVHSEVNSLITQINETSDRNVLLLENRLERLSNLISLSDKSITNMKNISLKNNRDIKNNESTIIEPNNKETDDLKVKQSNLKVESKSIDIEIVDEKQIEINDDNTLTSRERILLLHKQGISPSIIASQTKATIGEVELIISLSRG